MDMNHLRMLVAVDDAGGITAAADLLGVTQPSVSRALRKLESALEMSLVVPAGRGIELTADGRRLVTDARALVESFDALATRRAAPASTLRIASYEPWSTWFLPAALAAAGIERADLVELVPGDLEDALATSRIDLAVTAHPVPQRDVSYERIARVRTVEVAAARSGSAARGVAASKLPWVAPFVSTAGTINPRAGLDGWPGSRDRDVAFRVTMLETALTLCRSGAARALLPEPLVDQHNALVRAREALVVRPARVALPTLDVRLVHRADAPLDSAALDLLGSLRTLLG